MQWMGSTGPTVAKYHHAILTGNGFDPVPTVADIEPGDVIVILYPTGSTASGHVALVEDWPTLRVQLAGRLGDVPVLGVCRRLDEARPRLGRHPEEARRDVESGAGIGTMRLYADADCASSGTRGAPSLSPAFLSQSTHNMAIGRLR